MSLKEMENEYGDIKVTEDIGKRSLLYGIGAAIQFITFAYVNISCMVDSRWIANHFPRND